MARLILKFEERVLKECVVGLIETIGRLPDNTLIIDNPAVSGHHACVFREGDDFVVEDLDSTNGTFVNEKRVARHTLRHGDVVLAGKHTLVFDQMAAGQPVEPDEARPVVSNLSDTVFLDTQQHKALLARLTAAQAGALPTANVTAAPSRVAVLRVVAGRAEQFEYDLEAQTSLIGKADTSLVRLRGWFKPTVAVAITRSSNGYIATRLDGHTSINSRPLTDRSSLKDGDILRVSGLTLEFRLKDSSSDHTRHA